MYCDIIGPEVRVTITKAYEMPLSKPINFLFRGGEAAPRHGVDMCSGWGHCS